MPRLFVALLLMISLLQTRGVVAGTLEDVRGRGRLSCGITQDHAGFSTVDNDGERRGFLADQCNAVAAAVFGEIQVEYVTVTPADSLSMLQSRRVDLLATAEPWSFQRDVGLGLDLAAVTFYIGIDDAYRPAGVQVREGDDRWRDIVRWSLNVMLAAEELGVSRENVATIRATTRHARVRRMLGLDGDFGKTLGLSADWAYDIIRLVGNYADLWQRNFAPLGVGRGVNALWLNGGSLSALPFR